MTQAGEFPPSLYQRWPLGTTGIEMEKTDSFISQNPIAIYGLIEVHMAFFHKGTFHKASNTSSSLT